MHRNAALLHKQHRNDSCESRIYISLYLSCVNGNLSVLLSKFLTLVCISRTWRDFFLLAGALLHANYKMPFWDLTCWTCQCVNKVNLKKKAMRKKSDGHALLCCSHASFKVPPDRNQWQPCCHSARIGRLGGFKRSVLLFIPFLPHGRPCDGRPHTWMQRGAVLPQEAKDGDQVSSCHSSSRQLFSPFSFSTRTHVEQLVVKWSLLNVST